MITVVSKDFREKIKAVWAGIDRKTAAASGIYLSIQNGCLTLGATDGIRINKVGTKAVGARDDGLEPAWACPAWLISICKHLPRTASQVEIHNANGIVSIRGNGYEFSCCTLNGDVPKPLLEASK